MGLIDPLDRIEAYAAQIIAAMYIGEMATSPDDAIMGNLADRALKQAQILVNKAHAWKHDPKVGVDPA